MQQSQYSYAENSLWSYFSTKSFFMHQISRIYSHKFGLYLRYTVIVQHFTALCSKLGIFMNRTHRGSIFLLKLHLFRNFWSLVPICHLSLYGAPLKSWVKVYNDCLLIRQWVSDSVAQLLSGLHQWIC